jgi:hypothetical protein
MNKQELSKAFAIAAVALPGLLLGASIASAGGVAGDKASKAAPVPWTGPAPKAVCGPFDWTESGLQGQTTSWERSSGDSAGGYNCNLELVGQFRGEGSFSQDGPAFLDHCVYMGTENNPLMQRPGVVVIDVSDPTNPRPTAYLDDTPAGLNPHENLKVNEARKLLGVAQSNGPNFAVYDLSDCAHPILKGSITVAGSQGHMGGWAQDGMTYYIGQNFRGVGGTMPIIDVADPSNPKVLLTWTFTGDGRPHDLMTNKDGTRMYVVQPGAYGEPPTDSFVGPELLMILDVSDIQLRKPNPQIKTIGQVGWGDQGGAGHGEQPLLVSWNGRPHIITTSESGPQSGVGGLPAACARGVGAYGYVHIVDITDEKNPRIISELMDEVHDRQNCAAMLNEPPETGGGILDYSFERCNVDRPDNPTMAACNSRGVGTRVFDIRDPYHPAEIAYWKGPAPRTTFLPGSGSWGPGVDRTVEKQSGLPLFKKVPAANGKGRELLLYTVGDGNGLQILHFSNGFKSLHKDLFEKALEVD